jgi:hypothetical protein
MVKMMTTRMLTRDWRLLSLGLPLLALLWAGLTLYAHWGLFYSGVWRRKLRSIAT